MGWLKELFKQEEKHDWFRPNEDNFKEGYYFVRHDGQDMGVCYVTQRSYDSYKFKGEKCDQCDQWEYDSHIKLKHISITQTVNMYKKKMLNELNT